MTAPKIRSMKGGRIVCVTAYDAPGARIADAAGVDLILVGDSVGNTVLGFNSTIPVSMEDMERHVAAAARGTTRALLVGDMPFGSFQGSVSDAVANAVRLVQAGAHAVKLEGAYTDQIEAIVRAGIPCMGHVGMTPQSVHSFGGHKVQGRDAASQQVVSDAAAVQEAGAFAVVLELIPADLACEVTRQLAIPTIGIGAGPHCDGEIQVFHDVLGLSEREFRHSKRYMDSNKLMTEALKQYASDVRNKDFPTEDNSS